MLSEQRAVPSEQNTALCKQGAALCERRAVLYGQRAALYGQRAALCGRRAALLVGVIGLLLLAGCDRTMTEEDCRRIGETMRAAWAEEAKKVSPAGSDRSEKAAVVIEAEGEKLSSEWTSDCKRELVGRVVDSSELDCISRSKTLDELSRCAAR